MALTILLKILAVLGWILLSIIALIVLLLLIICLVPLRYRADIHVTEALSELTANGRAGWLLKLICLYFGFKDYVLNARVRIAWKNIFLTDNPDLIDSEETGKKEKAEETEKKEEPEAAADTEKADSAKEQAEEKAEETKGKDKQEKEQKKKEKKEKRAQKKAEKKEKEHAVQTSERKGIRFTLDRIYDTISEIKLAQDEIFAFFSVQSHRKFIRRVFKRLKKLGRTILPDELKVTGELGFEDPYTTARVEMLLSALWSRIPDFSLPELNYNEKVINLDGYIRGKLRVGSFVRFAVPLLLDINLYRTIKDAKALKRKLDHSAEIIKGGKAA